MRPIPVGASAAMIFSLLVAFIVTPWASLRLLRREKGGDHGDDVAKGIPLAQSFPQRTVLLMKPANINNQEKMLDIHNVKNDDSDNDDYIVFLSMVGHYFDNLYLYIKSLVIKVITQYIKVE
jgi:multidrug efflux pump subunit AcrB